MSKRGRRRQLAKVAALRIKSDKRFEPDDSCLFKVSETMDAGTAHQIRDINSSIDRLAARRRLTIPVTGHLARSRIAWKIDTFIEAILYRLVSLAQGAASSWNSGNALPAFLCSRAAVETCALLFDFQERLKALLLNQDLGGIDSLVMNRLFASRDKDWLAESPQLAAVNILTFVDKLDKKIPGVRQHYDRLSERCHPNSFGHHQLYTRTNYENGTVSFDHAKAMEDIRAVTLGMTLLTLAEHSIDEILAVSIKIAELHDSASTVASTGIP